MKVALEELPAYARQFVESLPKELGTKAYAVGLLGELGAGKTAFVQEVAKLLGIARSVTSPTFVIAQTYTINHQPFERLVHIDAYRLDSGESDTIGWKDFLNDPKNLVLVEWVDRAPGGIPAGTHTLNFTVIGENVRNIEEKKA
ncbi:MAG: tRNA (adenosine(37)-N6)-threonylcarbamoyltransferase complex ATPase subunit type 1 TsaE [Candidatus Paceibacterota bacterium]